MYPLVHSVAVRCGTGGLRDDGSEDSDSVFFLVETKFRNTRNTYHAERKRRVPMLSTHARVRRSKFLWRNTESFKGIPTSRSPAMTRKKKQRRQFSHTTPVHTAPVMMPKALAPSSGRQRLFRASARALGTGGRGGVKGLLRHRHTRVAMAGQHASRRFVRSARFL